MFTLLDSCSINASINKLNFAKIVWEQTQNSLFIIVIVAMRDNDYNNICNNYILIVFIFHLLAS